jgi:hypothetical protein
MNTVQQQQNPLPSLDEVNLRLKEIREDVNVRLREIRNKVSDDFIKEYIDGITSLELFGKLLEKEYHHDKKITAKRNASELLNKYNSILSSLEEIIRLEEIRSQKTQNGAGFRTFINKAKAATSTAVSKVKSIGSKEPIGPIEFKTITTMYKRTERIVDNNSAVFKNLQEWHKIFIIDQTSSKQVTIDDLLNTMLGMVAKELITRFNDKNFKNSNYSNPDNIPTLFERVNLNYDYIIQFKPITDVYRNGREDDEIFVERFPKLVIAYFGRVVYDPNTDDSWEIEKKRLILYLFFIFFLDKGIETLVNGFKYNESSNTSSGGRRSSEPKKNTARGAPKRTPTVDTATAKPKNARTTAATKQKKPTTMPKKPTTMPKNTRATTTVATAVTKPKKPTTTPKNTRATTTVATAVTKPKKPTTTPKNTRTTVATAAAKQKKARTTPKTK